MTRVWIVRIAAVVVSALAFVGPSSFALQWESIGPDGGRVDGLAQAPSNPDRMYVLPYRQGVWRSENRGGSWARVDTGLAEDATYEAIAVSSVDQDIVIIAPQTGEWLLRSTDAGMTWSVAVIPSGIQRINDISFDPFNGRNVLLSSELGSGQGVYRSTDAGVSWVFSNTGLGISSPNQFAYHPTIPGTVFVATGVAGFPGDGVYRSTNGGSLWMPANMNGNTTAGHISICRSTPSRIWSAGSGLLRSTDGGLTFQGMGDPSDCDFNCSLDAVLASPADVDAVLGTILRFSCWSYCESFASVRRTTNSGGSWSNDPFVPNGEYVETQKISSLFFDAAPTNQAFLSLGNGLGNSVRVGLARTTDGGATWNPGMDGLPGLRIMKVGGDNFGRVYARAPMERGLWGASAPANGWTNLSETMPGMFFPTALEVSSAIPGIVNEGGGTSGGDTFVCRFMRSIDHGQTWVEGVVPQPDLYSRPVAIASDHLDAQSVYLWCESISSPDYLCRSTNGGLSFDIVHEGFLAADAVVDVFDPNRVYAIRSGAPGDVQLTTDGGGTWIPRSAGLPSGQAIALLADTADPDRFAAVYRTAGIYITTDAGLTWNPVPLPGYSSQTILDAAWDAGSARFFLAIQGQGVYVSGAGFVTDGLSTSLVTSICYEPLSQSLLVGTEHASVFHLDVGGAVEASSIQPLPPDLAVRGRPNPSSGAFHFELDVAHSSSRAQLSIFDVGGRRIATPFVGSLSQGRHVVDWTGRINSGERAAPGVYFARLEADGIVTATRITVVE